MNTAQFFLVLRSRWRGAANIVIGVFVLALVVSLLLPRKYTAYSSVLVDVMADPVSATQVPTQLTTSIMSTQVDIAESARVARRVVKVMKLDMDQQLRGKWIDKTGGRGDLVAWLGEMLQENLVVTPSRESNVINFAFTWTDPKGAAAFANAFADADIATNIELKVDPAKEYATWFDARSKALRADLEAKQKRLSDYQREKGIVETDEKLDIEVARLNELSTQLVQIETLRQDSQSRQRQSTASLETLPEVLQSPLINSLKTSLSQSEAKLQDIAANLGKNHPDYKTTLSEVQSLRERIAQETANVVASLGSTTQVNVRREQDIRAALEAQKKRVLDLRQQHDDAAVLESDVAEAQRNLDAVSQRLAQSNLESLSQQTNITPLTVATEPVKPSSPRLLRNLAVALIVGVFLGALNIIVRERLDPRVRSEEDLVLTFEMPILGTIGSAKLLMRGQLPPPAASAVEPYTI